MDAAVAGCAGTVTGCSVALHATGSRLREDEQQKGQQDEEEHGRAGAGHRGTRRTGGEHSEMQGDKLKGDQGCGEEVMVVGD